MKPSQISMRNPSTIREFSSNFIPEGSECASSLGGVTSDVEKVIDATDQHIRFEEKDQTDISVMTRVRKKSEELNFLESENQRRSDKPKISFEKDASKDPKDIFLSRELRQIITREAVGGLDDSKWRSACLLDGGHQSNVDQKNLGRFFAVDTAYEQEDVVRKSIHFSVQILSELERRLDVRRNAEDIDDGKSMLLDIESIKKFLDIGIEVEIGIESKRSMYEEKDLLGIHGKNVSAALSRQKTEELFQQGLERLSLGGAEGLSSGGGAERLSLGEAERLSLVGLEVLWDQGLGFFDRSTEKDRTARERIQCGFPLTQDVGISLIEEKQKSVIDRYRLEDLDVYFSIEQLDLLEANELREDLGYNLLICGNARFKKALSADSDNLKELSVEERELEEYYRGTHWPDGDFYLSALRVFIKNIIMQKKDFSSDLDNILNGMKGNGARHLVNIIQDILLEEKSIINFILEREKNSSDASKHVAGTYGLQLDQEYENRLKTIFSWVQKNAVALESTEKEWIDFVVHYARIRESAEIIDKVTLSCRSEEDKVETLSTLLDYFYFKLMEVKRSCSDSLPERDKSTEWSVFWEDDELNVLVKPTEQVNLESEQVEAARVEAEEMPGAINRAIAEEQEYLGTQFERDRRVQPNMIQENTQHINTQQIDNQKCQEVLKELLEIFEKTNHDSLVLGSEKVADVLRGLKIAKMFASARDFIKESCEGSADLYHLHQNAPLMLRRDDNVFLKDMMSTSVATSILLPEAMPALLAETFKHMSAPCALIVQFVQYFEANKDTLYIVSPGLVNIFDRIKYLLENCQDAVMQILYCKETKMFDLRCDMLLCYFAAHGDEDFMYNSLSKVMRQEKKSELPSSELLQGKESELPSAELHVVLQPIFEGYESSFDVVVDSSKDVDRGIHDWNPNIVYAQETGMDVPGNQVVCYAKVNWEQGYKPQHILRVLMGLVRNELLSKDRIISVSSESVYSEDFLVVREYRNMLSEEKCAEMLNKIVRLECSKESFYEVWSEQLPCVKKFFMYQLLISEEEVSRQLMELWSIWQADDILSRKDSELENYLTEISYEILYQIYTKETREGYAKGTGEWDRHARSNMLSSFDFLNGMVLHRKSVRKQNMITGKTSEGVRRTTQELLRNWKDIIDSMKKLCLIESEYSMSRIVLGYRVINCLKIFYSVNNAAWINFFWNISSNTVITGIDNQAIEIDFCKVLLNRCADAFQKSNDYCVIGRVLFRIISKGIEESLLYDQPFYEKEISLLRNSFDISQLCSMSINSKIKQILGRNPFLDLFEKILFFVFFNQRDALDGDFYNSFLNYAPYLLFRLGKIVSRSIEQVIRNLQSRLVPGLLEPVGTISENDKAILKRAIHLYREICFPIKYFTESEVGINPRDTFIVGARKIDQLLSFCQEHKNFLSDNNALIPVTIIKTILGDDPMTTKIQDSAEWEKCYILTSDIQNEGVEQEWIHSTVFCYHSLMMIKLGNSNLYELAGSIHWSEEDTVFFLEKASYQNKKKWITQNGRQVWDCFLRIRSKGVKGIKDLDQELLLLDAFRLPRDLPISSYTTILSAEQLKKILDKISLCKSYLSVEQGKFNGSIEKTREIIIVVSSYIVGVWGIIRREVDALPGSRDLIENEEYIWNSYKFNCPVLLLNVFREYLKSNQSDRNQSSSCKEVIDGWPWLRLFFSDIAYNPGDLENLPCSKDLLLQIAGKCFYRCMHSDYYLNYKGFWLGPMGLRISMLRSDEKNIFFESVLSSILNIQEECCTAFLYWLRANLVDKDVIYAIRDKLNDPVQKLLFSCYFLPEAECENLIQEQKMSPASLEFLKSERKRFLEIREDDDNQYSKKEKLKRIAHLQNIFYQMSETEGSEIEESEIEGV